MATDQDCCNQCCKASSEATQTLSQQIGSIAKGIAGVAGTISDFYGAGQLADACLNKIFGDDEMADIKAKLDDISNQLTTIEANLVNLQISVLDEAEQNTGENLDIMSGHSTTAIYKSKSLHDDPGNSGNLQGFIDEQDKVEDAIAALESNLTSPIVLSGDNTTWHGWFWVRLFSDILTYNNAFTGKVYPEEITPPQFPKYVWDHRLALPFYMTFIQAYIYTIAAHKTDEAKDVILNSAEGLTKVYNKIRQSSYYSIKPPSKDGLIANILDFHLGLSSYQIENGPAAPNNQEGINWEQTGRIYGAIEPYSGLACTASYKDEEFVDGASCIDIQWDPGGVLDPSGTEDPSSPYLWWSVDPDGFNMFYNKFLFRHALRTLRMHKELYVNLALKDLRDLIYQLYQLTGEMPPDLYDDTVYSIRQVYGVVPDLLREGLGLVGLIVLRRLISLNVQAGDSISLRKMLLLDEDINYVGNS